MLKAFQNRKFRLAYSENHGERIEDTLKEDTLTASVFGRFAYLPHTLLEKIWDEILKDGSGNTPKLGRFVEQKFWPNWNLPPEDTRGKRCQPDMLVRFEYADIIVEAKRQDAQQYSEQWNKEFAGYEHDNNVEDLKDTVYLLAIGGYNGSDEGSPEGFRLVLRSWEQLWCDILTKFADEQDEQHVRTILDDIHVALELHNIYTSKIGFEDYIEDCSSLKIDIAQAVFTQWDVVT
jgi:hypothetical protein